MSEAVAVTGAPSARGTRPSGFTDLRRSTWQRGRVGGGVFGVVRPHDAIRGRHPAGV